MTTSGTSTFNLANADIVLEAFDRLQVRPGAITNEHMVSARRSLNLELTSWDNRGINLWAVDLQELALIEGQTSYELSQTTITTLDVYIRQEASGSSQPIDRIMNPIGRSEYAMIPNKEQEGFPTVYWFDRTTTPTLHIWQPANATGVYTLRCYRMRRLEDAAPNMVQTADVPYRFLDALSAGLAARLARKYRPEAVAELKLEAAEALMLAIVEDRERVPLYIQPDFGPYFNN